MTEGEILAKARTRSKYSQAELARKLGYAQAQFISNIERGHAAIPMGKLGRLAILVGRLPVKRIIDVRVAKLRARLEQELE